LASQSVGVMAESTKAHKYCRTGCTYDSKSPAAGRPFSFANSPCPCSSSSKAARPSPAFRQQSWAEVKVTLDRCKAATSDKERKRIMKEHGIVKLYCALEYIRHCDPTTATPVDILHLFPDGLLRSEGAWLMYILIKMGLDLDTVNEAVRSYRHWPPDVRIPPLHPSLKKGRKGGKPKSAAVLRMTGSQCMHFALHSPALLTPLLTNEMCAHPAWRSWLTLVKLFGMCVKHSIAVDEIKTIDELQQQHSAAFDAVPQYTGLKRPKHHFCAHLAHDIWLYGPPRGYWCFGYEAFNSVIKAGAKRSNWRDTTYSIMEYWSMRSGRALIATKQAAAIQIV